MCHYHCRCRPARGSIAAHGAIIDKCQRTSVVNTSPLFAFSIANSDSTDVHCDSGGKDDQDSAVRAYTLVAVDDRGRGFTAGDSEIPSDRQFGYLGQEVSIAAAG